MSENNYEESNTITKEDSLLSLGTNNKMSPLVLKKEHKEEISNLHNNYFTLHFDFVTSAIVPFLLFLVTILILSINKKNKKIKKILRLKNLKKELNSKISEINSDIKNLESNSCHVITQYEELKKKIKSKQEVINRELNSIKAEIKNIFFSSDKNKLLLTKFEEVLDFLNIKLEKTKIHEYKLFLNSDIDKINDQKILEKYLNYSFHWETQFDFYVKKIELSKIDDKAIKSIKELAELLDYSMIIPIQNENYTPSIHIPIGEKNVEGISSGSIASVELLGYKKGNKVIQKAKVILGK